MTSSRHLEEEIDKFDPDEGPEDSRTPPASWYTWSDFHHYERVHVFKNTWQAVVLASEVAEPGQFVAGSFHDWPWIVVRDASGELRAMRNMCRHRATRILEGDGCISKIRCPYHGWTYELDGTLRSAPDLGAVKGFDRESHALQAMPITTFGPLVFVRFGEPGLSPTEVWPGLEEIMDETGWNTLNFFHRREYEISCNWKVFVDNYLDGGYHVPHLHKGLGGQLDLDSYKTTVKEHYVVQTCEGAKSAPGPEIAKLDIRERVGNHATYVWTFSNLMINRYGPFLDINRVIPLDEGRCRIIFDYFVEDDRLDDQDFLARSLEASHRVQLEDVAVCESVQTGLRSGDFLGGPYAIPRQGGEHRFHCALARLLRRK